jgi:hypothetical protein
MGIAAMVSAVLAVLCFLLALFGASLGVDPNTLGLVFVAATLLFMNLPPVVRR